MRTFMIFLSPYNLVLGCCLHIVNGRFVLRPYVQGNVTEYKKMWHFKVCSHTFWSGVTKTRKGERLWERSCRFIGTCDTQLGSLACETLGYWLSGTARYQHHDVPPDSLSSSSRILELWWDELLFRKIKNKNSESCSMTADSWRIITDVSVKFMWLHDRNRATTTNIEAKELNPSEL